MSMLEPIRNYCERTADTFWAEPINAITNASFLIAAWLLWKAYKATGKKDQQLCILITLVAIVGIGSFLFHTFANRLTMLMDVIPIMLFTLTYLWAAMRTLLAWNKATSAVCLIAFIIVAMQMGNVPPEYSFNGSVSYFPCLAALIIIGALLRGKKHPSAKFILGGAVCFIASLTFRSVDYMVCPAFSLGTHFMWHTLNGVLLYLLTSAFIERPSITDKSTN
jgi:hypothetical protein